jgi:hypothetical protein
MMGDHISYVLLFRSLLTFRSTVLWNSHEATPPKGGIEECKLIRALRTGIPLRILGSGWIDYAQQEAAAYVISSFSKLQVIGGSITHHLICTT